MTLKNISLRDIGLRLTLLFCFLCPIFFDPSHQFGISQLRVNQEQFFQLCVTTLFAVVILENIYLSLFLLWAETLYIYYGFPAIGGSYVMNIFLGCVLYQVSYSVFGKDNIHRLYKTILWLCALNAVWIILQLFGLDFIFLEHSSYTHAPVGFMGLKAFMGMLFAIGIPFMCRYNLWIPALMFVPIYISECSVAMVAGALAWLYCLWHESMKAFISLVLVLLVGCSIYVSNDTKGGMFTDRINLWKVVLQDAAKHPVMGWGLDSFRNVGTFKPFIYMKNVRTLKSFPVSWDAIRQYQETGRMPKMGELIGDNDTLDPWDNPHNEYVGLWYEFGAVALAIMLFLFRNIVERTGNSRDTRPLTGFFIVIAVTSLGQFPFHIARIGCLIAVALGAFYKLTDEEANGRAIQYGT